MTYDYLPYFKDSGIECIVSPLLDDTFLDLTQEGKVRERLQHLLIRGFERLKHIVRSKSFDVVVLEKDLIPYLPYGLERLLFSLNRNVITMYDEATHRFYQEHRNPFVRLLTQQKIERIMKMAAHVVVWNPVMREFARSRNENVSEVTTGIDLQRYQVKSSYSPETNRVRIGWIGSPSGFSYLHRLDSVFHHLARKYDIELYVVSSTRYEMEGIPVTSRPWSVATETSDLRAMDIGVMPLPNDEWALGKSGCKMLQYMGVGLPVVVSPVGVNASVVSHGLNGFLATSEDEWIEYLSLLVEHTHLRQQLGRAGRHYIELHNAQDEIAAILTDIIKRVATSSKGRHFDEVA